MVSPAPLVPSPLSTTFEILVTSNEPPDDVAITVESLEVSPSLSSPSSLISNTLFVFPGLLAVT
jgi:hypothetical protein